MWPLGTEFEEMLLLGDPGGLFPPLGFWDSTAKELVPISTSWVMSVTSRCGKPKPGVGGAGGLGVSWFSLEYLWGEFLAIQIPPHFYGKGAQNVPAWLNWKLPFRISPAQTLSSFL